jgi:uncharacterized membrane protein
MPFFATALAFIGRPRVIDNALRGLILSLALSGFAYVVHSWPAIQRFFLLEINHVLSVVLTWLVVLAVLFFFFAPLIAVTRSGIALGCLGAAFLKGVTRMAQIAIMTVINTAILLLSVLTAACSKEGIAAKVTEAGTHYIERQADLLFGWMGK